jgi:hypothetical protein
LAAWYSAFSEIAMSARLGDRLNDSQALLGLEAYSSAVTHSWPSAVIGTFSIAMADFSSTHFGRWARA